MRTRKRNPNNPYNSVLLNRILRNLKRRGEAYFLTPIKKNKITWKESFQLCCDYLNYEHKIETFDPWSDRINQLSYYLEYTMSINRPWEEAEFRILERLNEDLGNKSDERELRAFTHSLIGKVIMKFHRSANYKIPNSDSMNKNLKRLSAKLSGNRLSDKGRNQRGSDWDFVLRELAQNKNRREDLRGDLIEIGMQKMRNLEKIEV
ncbi:hypothetical protein [Leptospira idonii]|uniref:Uncharacterized protein n=1 Tax=Leptospira idonii TaxID=1193500 RepID=A0A4R9LY87_9LEPT|nr:hypothetical protein [Leptospira idonii]TGN17485.1 hypothetical protein EHS15_17080 [Leptospira idonii]